MVDVDMSMCYFI